MMTRDELLNPPSHSNGNRALQPGTIALLVLVAFLWALCFPLISVGLEFAPPPSFAGLRAFIAGATQLITLPGLLELYDAGALIGILHLMGGAFGVALANMELECLSGRIDPLMVVGWQLLIGSLPLLAAGQFIAHRDRAPPGHHQERHAPSATQGENRMKTFATASFLALLLASPVSFGEQHGGGMMNMQERMQNMDHTMQQVQETKDMGKRRQLMHEHMQQMQEGMGMMNDMMGGRGKMMSGMGGGMGMMGGSSDSGSGMGMGMMGKNQGGMKDDRMGKQGAGMSEDMMSRKMDRMEGRMDMMQMMMDQMMEHQRQYEMMQGK